MNKRKKIAVSFLCIGLLFVILSLVYDNSIIITFDSNGGTIIEPIEVKKNKNVVLPTEVYKNGYLFDGWLLNNEKVNNSFSSKEDVTLKAKWVRSFVISFVIDEDNQYEELVKYNDKVQVPPVPKKDGYLFEGWYVKNKVYDFNLNVNSDLILTAKWKKAPLVAVEEIKLNCDSLILVENETKNLSVAFYPSNVTDKKIMWRSSNEKVVTVTEGKVVAHNVGTAVVEAVSSNGKRDKVNVKVVKKLEKIEVDNDKKNNYISLYGTNKEVVLYVKPIPSNSYVDDVKWEFDKNSCVETKAEGNNLRVTAKECKVLTPFTVKAVVDEGFITYTVFIEPKFELKKLDSDGRRDETKERVYYYLKNNTGKWESNVLNTKWEYTKGKVNFEFDDLKKTLTFKTSDKVIDGDAIKIKASTMAGQVYEIKIVLYNYV